mmetsp:Transcript_9179/g.24031  ORF Transcript_9179/g.24031 Transcript_9179/m.24031 type:complete len:224 (-) Transcript_9179:30-701(-)
MPGWPCAHCKNSTTSRSCGPRGTTSPKSTKSPESLSVSEPSIASAEAVVWIPSMGKGTGTEAAAVAARKTSRARGDAVGLKVCSRFGFRTDGGTRRKPCAPIAATPPTVLMRRQRRSSAIRRPMRSPRRFASIQAARVLLAAMAVVTMAIAADVPPTRGLGVAADGEVGKLHGPSATRNGILPSAGSRQPRLQGSTRAQRPKPLVGGEDTSRNKASGKAAMRR